MRVWVISSSYPRQPDESINAGVLARDLAREIAGRGHEVTVVTPDKPGGVHFDDELHGLVLPWWRPSVSLSDISPRSPRDVWRVASLFMRGRRVLLRAAQVTPPDAVIALWGIPSGIFARWAAAATGAPYVTWLLGSDVWRAPAVPCGVRTLRWVLAGAEANFADGSDLATEATRLTGRPISYLPSVRRLPPPAASCPPTGDLLFVGRYHANKGPDVLMEAFAEVHEERPDATLTLRGGGDLETQLRARVDTLGLNDVVDLSGPVGAADLAAMLQRAQALVIPSRIESIPLILGDAVQAGTPVIVGDVGDMGDFVRRHDLGRVVAADDPTALAAAMLDVLAEGRLWPEMASARSVLSPEAVADGLLQSLGMA